MIVFRYHTTLCKGVWTMKPSGCLHAGIPYLV